MQVKPVSKTKATACLTECLAVRPLSSSKALAVANGAAYDAPVSGGCCEQISHSWYGLGLGQALLLAAAVDEVMGLLVACDRTAAIALKQEELVERKTKNCYCREMP